MPQSLSSLLIHLAFSTKNREPCLTGKAGAEIHPYLAGVLNNLDCPSLQAGGASDPVHLFFRLSRTRAMAEIVEALKTSSSK
ncbi:MAG TPA: transposase, partial [Chthoniobacterales bacterium]